MMWSGEAGTTKTAVVISREAAADTRSVDGPRPDEWRESIL